MGNINFLMSLTTDVVYVCDMVSIKIFNDKVTHMDLVFIFIKETHVFNAVFANSFIDKVLVLKNFIIVF